MDRRDSFKFASNTTKSDASFNDFDHEEVNIGHLREELSEIPFCELEELKQKVGCKRYNKVIHGLFDKEGRTSRVKKRENKNTPTEMSSKKKVPRLRQVIPVKKRVSRDPRFDELSGTFNQEKFDEAYSFLDDIKANEKEQLKRELRKTKQLDRKHQLQSLLKRMEQQEAAKKSADAKREAERQRKKAEMELVKQGKRPFYLKKSDKKKLELAERYKELKSSGKLEKYLKRKGKKMASKERKRMPHRRGLET